MSVRGFRETHRCPDCQLGVSYMDEKCPKGHYLEWDGAPATRAAPPAGTKTNKPTTLLETKIDWGVFGLYILIVAVLGTALVYSLSKGSDYASFSSAIVTALTTIAGFAVGVNSGSPSTSTPSQRK